MFGNPHPCVVIDWLELLMTHHTPLDDLQIEKSVLLSPSKSGNSFTDAPAWSIVRIWPAIDSVVLRDARPVFGATEYCNVPLELPMPPDVIVTQPALLAEVQLHPEAVMFTMPLPPARGKDCREEERLVEQVSPALTIFSTTPA